MSGPSAAGQLLRLPVREGVMTEASACEFVLGTPPPPRAPHGRVTGVTRPARACDGRQRSSEEGGSAHVAALGKRPGGAPLSAGDARCTHVREGCRVPHASRGPVGRGSGEDGLAGGTSLPSKEDTSPSLDAGWHGDGDPGSASASQPGARAWPTPAPLSPRGRPAPPLGQQRGQQRGRPPPTAREGPARVAGPQRGWGWTAGPSALRSGPGHAGRSVGGPALRDACPPPAPGLL